MSRIGNIEVFYVSYSAFRFADSYSWQFKRFEQGVCGSWADESTKSAEVDAATALAGWYWWSCLPGCLPDGDAIGPFESEQAAINDARNFD